MISEINQEICFFFKVARNGFILGGLYFLSVFASSEQLNYFLMKPILIFLGTYILTELTKRYGLDKGVIKSQNKKAQTLLFD